MKPDENGGRVGEPQEHDSMLDGSEIAKRRPNCVRRAADSLGLSVRWMLALSALAVLALVLLAVVILLAVSWPPPPVEDTAERCETSDCLRAAAQVSRQPVLQRRPAPAPAAIVISRVCGRPTGAKSDVSHR